MYKRSNLILLLTILFSIGLWSGNAQEQTETPTPPPIQSIFDYDTCDPPCWMGIVAGESISTDVDIALQMLDELGLLTWLSEPINRGDNFDSATGLFLTGGYGFHIGKFEPDPIDLASRIEVREGRVDLMVIEAHEAIPLIEVLNNLGNSDISRLHVGTTDWVRIVLIYLDLRLRVNLVQPKDNCRTGMLPEELIVDSVLYFSSSAATSLVPSADYDFLQPALTRFGLLNDRDVPQDLWQSWLEGEVDMSCEEAWALLPEPEITPVYPTPTPTPEDNSEQNK